MGAVVMYKRIRQIGEEEYRKIVLSLMEKMQSDHFYQGLDELVRDQGYNTIFESLAHQINGEEDHTYPFIMDTMSDFVQDKLDSYSMDMQKILCMTNLETELGCSDDELDDALRELCQNIMQEVSEAAEDSWHPMDEWEQACFDLSTELGRLVDYVFESVDVKFKEEHPERINIYRSMMLLCGAYYAFDHGHGIDDDVFWESELANIPPEAAALMYRIYDSIRYDEAHSEEDTIDPTEDHVDSLRMYSGEIARHIFTKEILEGESFYIYQPILTDAIGEFVTYIRQEWVNK